MEASLSSLQGQDGHSLALQHLMENQEDECDDDKFNALDDTLILNDEDGGQRIGDIYISAPVPPHCSMASVAPRLIVKRIVNVNFKSNAGKVELGPFHHPFTAIIGPIGSGKGNAIDSMMFVFGYGSNRISCELPSMFIHNSREYPHLESCSVTVHFQLIVDNGEGQGTCIPNADLVVQRTAMADNTSFYQIDHQLAELKDILELMKSYNFDLKFHRFLIVQNQLNSIAMMEPRAQDLNEMGLLEYLDNVIGTRRYVRPLQLIYYRLKELNDDRIERFNRCEHVKRELNDLKEPYNEAVEYLQNENKLLQVTNWVTQKNMSIKKQELEKCIKEHKNWKQALITLDSETCTLQKKREEKELVLQYEIEVAYEQLVKWRKDIQQKLVDAERSYTEVESAMENATEELNKDIAELDKSEKELENLQKFFEENEKVVDEPEKLELENQPKEKSAAITGNRLNYSEVLVQVEASSEESATENEKISHNVASTTELDIERLKSHNNNLSEKIKNAEDKLRELKAERTQCTEVRVELEEQAAKAEKAIENAKTETLDAKKEIKELEKQENKHILERNGLEEKLKIAKTKMNKVQSNLLGLQSQLKAFKINVLPDNKIGPLRLETLKAEELEIGSMEDMLNKATVLEDQIRNKPNLNFIKEYTDKRLLFVQRVRDLNNYTTLRNNLLIISDELRRRRNTEFMEALKIITGKLKEVYEMLSVGGDAKLELVDPICPFTKGVQFTVCPPEKTWKNISNLSGGEKTLASLALVSALHYYKPLPFYFMDEIDAALDSKNASIVGHYIKECMKNAQLIIVSPRENMFEQPDYLAGIHKLRDCGKAFTLENHPPLKD